MHGNSGSRRNSPRIYPLEWLGPALLAPRTEQASRLKAALPIRTLARGGGLEPPITGPEPAVLPITPPPNGRRHRNRRDPWANQAA